MQLGIRNHKQTRKLFSRVCHCLKTAYADGALSLTEAGATAGAGAGAGGTTVVVLIVPAFTVVPQELQPAAAGATT